MEQSVVKNVVKKVKETVNQAVVEPIVNLKTVIKKPHTVTIKYRGVEAIVDRKMFINVQESPDGLVFNFANGMHLVYTNQHLGNANKIRVTAATNTFLSSKTDNGSLIIDLDNPTKPVKAILAS
jgi:hypothetical protein